MWKRKNDDGPSGTRSLIKQNLKDLKMQGIDINKNENQEHLMYPPLKKDIELKDYKSELDEKIIRESHAIRKRQNLGQLSICKLFSTPLSSKSGDYLEEDELKKKLYKAILPKLLPNFTPKELTGEIDERKEEEKKDRKRKREEEETIKNKRPKLKEGNTAEQGFKEVWEKR